MLWSIIYNIVIYDKFSHKIYDLYGKLCIVIKSLITIHIKTYDKSTGIHLKAYD